MTEKTENKRARILVADDENFVHQLFKHSFSDEYELAFASNGLEALMKFHAWKPNVLLLDLYMPEMDGYELLAKLKPRIDDPYEVIVITGENKDEAVQTCYALGVSAFLHKPINVIEAGEIIKRSIKVKTLARERREMEVQLRMNQKLQAIGELASGIAHEINTPIQFVGGNLVFLEDLFNDILGALARLDDRVGQITAQGQDDGLAALISEILAEIDYGYVKTEVPKTFAQTKDGIERVSEIIKAMKAFSHPGGRERVPMDVNDILNNTLVVARNSIKYVAEVDTHLSMDLPVFYGYDNEIGQAFLNIIVNASQAIAEKLGDDRSEKGLITITTALAHPWIEIRIADTGTGIPAEIQERIFDPFFTTKDVGQGTGQGLSITYSIITKHGGELSLETREGQGTTFIIRLPAASAPEVN